MLKPGLSYLHLSFRNTGILLVKIIQYLQLLLFIEFYSTFLLFFVNCEWKLLEMDRLTRAGALGHEEVLTEIERLVDGLDRSFPEEFQQNQRLENVLNQVTLNLDRLRNGYVRSEHFDRVESKHNALKTRFLELQQQHAEVEIENNGGCITNLERISNGKRGPSRYGINKERLEHFLNIGCNVTQIAKDGLLGKKIHPNTVFNFMKANDIPMIRRRYTQLSDEELEIKILDLHVRFPNSGIREIASMLKKLDPPVIVQRDRVGKLLAKVDPTGTARRWAQIIPRRTYSVPTPNSLWHIDTHHSLIRYDYV